MDIKIYHCLKCKGIGLGGQELVKGEDGVQRMQDVPCAICDGTGHLIETDDNKRCGYCNGSGEGNRITTLVDDLGVKSVGKPKCEHCDGLGMKTTEGS